MAEESLQTMTIQQMMDQLSLIASEHRDKEVTLYDTLTGHLYTPKELLYIDEREDTVNDKDIPGKQIHHLSSNKFTCGEKDAQLDLPSFNGSDVVILTF